MGKKKGKKDKKGQGAEKTAMKTEKNAQKKQKKLLQEKGEEDIEALIKQFTEQDRKRNQIEEEKCPPPSPRCNMSLTPHPDKDELIMFGGEYFNGNKTFLYNDLFFFNTKTHEWTKVKVPNAPPPRSAHQAVLLRQGGGQLWIFGGEFSSPTQSQFYHYKDLWVYHIKDKKWDKISAPGGPSARSGHRMVACKKHIIVFGGFHDNIRDYKYFNDVYAFSIDTFTWAKLDPSGTGPSPRSGCQFTATQDGLQLLLYGGYSKERVRRDVDQGKMHSDMFILTPEGKKKEEALAEGKWKWMPVRQSGMRPGPRCGFSMVTVPGNRAIFFGGVFDEEEDEEFVEGKFYNEMYSLEVDKGKWHEVFLRGKKENKDKKKRRRKKDKSEDGEDGEEEEEEEDENSDVDEEMEETIEGLSMSDSQGAAQEGAPAQGAPASTDSDPVFKVTVAPPATNSPVVSDGIFTCTVGGSSSGAGASNDLTAGGGGGDSGAQEGFLPSPRMNALMAVKGGTLYMYGGIYEEGDKQFTLSDMYCLDLHKLDEWKTIIENTNVAQQEWVESDSEGEDEKAGASGSKKRPAEDEDSSDEDDDDDDSDMDEDPPEVVSGESATDYFSRSRDFWMQQADEMAEKSGVELSGRALKKRALQLAEEYYGTQSKPKEDI